MAKPDPALAPVTGSASGSSYWAIVLRLGFIPIKKRLPLYAADQVPILRELQRLHPKALLAVVDACGAEIAVWHPKDVEAMAACEPNTKFSRAAPTTEDQRHE